MLDVRLHSTGPFRIDFHQSIPDTITAVFGRSGAGKSTLLRAIAGFEPATGLISLNEQTWLDSENAVFVPAYRRRIGYVRQTPALFPHLNVRRNLTFPLQHGRGHPEEITLDDVVSYFNLEKLLNRLPHALSGGETQRVAIARALLTQPRLLLLDEPLTGLDLERKAEVLPLLQTLHEHYRIPTLYVSHAIDEVVAICQNTLILSDGQVAASGSTREVLERRDLDDVLGANEPSSLVRAIVLSHDAKYQLTTVQVEDSVWSIPIQITVAPDTATKLRVRARDVALAGQKPQKISVRNTLEGTIASIDIDESGPIADCYIQSGATRLRARITRAALDDLGFKEGDSVFALVKAVTLDTI